MTPFVDLFLELGKLLLSALDPRLTEEAQLEAERQALILAQRRIQEEIARRELPP